MRRVILRRTAPPSGFCRTAHRTSASSTSSNGSRGWSAPRLGALGLGLGATATVVLGGAAFVSCSSPAAAGFYSPKYVATDDSSLRTISLEEVAKHNKDGDAWVSYNGYVYDVTPFIENHPGGKELILTAAGLDLGHFFETYKVHTDSAKAMEYLEGMRIGKLAKGDAAKARAATTPEVHVEHRLAVLGRARRRMLVVIAMIPFWLLLRTFLRIIGLVLPPVVHMLGRSLPVSIPGYGDAQRLPPVDKKSGKRHRVAVVGGGIAGSGCAWALKQSGFEVTLYEARKQTSGNARTFDWKVKDKTVKTCVSVTAWPPHYYKNYVELLRVLGVETKRQHLSWFLNSKVPGHEGFLWPADASAPEGSLRKHFQKDFDRYGRVISLVDNVTKVMTGEFLNKEISMYTLQGGLGPINPFSTMPLWWVCKLFGVSREWWDVVFTPYYTASFLTDKLDNMVAVTGPAIEGQIPLLPHKGNATDSIITTCDTWANAGDGLREVFAKLNKGIDLRVDTRVLKVEPAANGQVDVRDEHGTTETFDRVVFACPVNAVGNMLTKHNWIEDTILSVPEYADDFHPASGHTHSIMHNDASVIPAEYRDDVLKRGSNYVEITKMQDGSINIENTYNFGVQTPSLVGKSLSEKPPLLITHALGEGKSIDPSKILGGANHVRAHPLWSGWNLSTALTMRLFQGRRGIFYCANYTTPGNCHDMSFLSGLAAAHAVGAEYPFPDNVECKKDFQRLRGLMGI